MSHTQSHNSDDLRVQIAKLQNKINQLVRERDQIKEERDDLRARMTVMRAGFNAEGIINEVKWLQQENEQLRIRLSNESPIAMLTTEQLPPSAELLLTQGKELSAGEINTVLQFILRDAESNNHGHWVVKGVSNLTPQGAQQVLLKFGSMVFTEVEDEDISGDNFSYLPDSEFKEILNQLVGPYFNSHEEYLQKRKELRSRLWAQIGSNLKGDKDQFDRTFDRKCDRSLENMSKRLMPIDNT